MRHKAILAGLLASLFCWTTAATAQLTDIERLGKDLFFDTNLSTPPGQACAACHGPAVGWTGPDSEINAHGAVYPGAVHTRTGNRKPPAASYAGDSPVLHFDESQQTWIGGMFWDGRATGSTLGDPLAEQAEGPFLNPLEQNNPNARHVVINVSQSSYADLFRQVWGPDSLDFKKDVSGSYERIARSIAAYERSAEVSAFTSKYDAYLKGEASLSSQEQSGLQLFEGKGKCAGCHTSEAGPNGESPLFTDYSYDSLGVPKNPENPFYTMPPKFNPAGAAFVDVGLGGFLKSAGYPAEVYEPQLGKFKVPTVRNVDKRPDAATVKAYSHNGFFKSLEEIVHFYNTRDVGTWPPPEYPLNINTTEVGNLGLTAQEEADIVAFLKTLSDGYTP